MPPPQDAVTELLHAAHRGDTNAFDEIVALVYDELHRLAHQVRHGRAGETLNTTALVHEAYARLLPSKDLHWNDRTHFFRVAARAMRQVLIRAAQERTRQKRGGGQVAVTLNEDVYAAPVQAEDLLTLNDALGRLEAMAPRQVQIIECRYFAGLTVEETAQALGIGAATVKRDWRAARAWLVRELKESP